MSDNLGVRVTALEFGVLHLVYTKKVSRSVGKRRNMSAKTVSREIITRETHVSA